MPSRSGRTAERAAELIPAVFNLPGAYDQGGPAHMSAASPCVSEDVAQPAIPPTSVPNRLNVARCSVATTSCPRASYDTVPTSPPPCHLPSSPSWPVSSIPSPRLCGGNGESEDRRHKAGGSHIPFLSV